MFQRLKSFPIREQISEDDLPETSEEPLIFTGAIYGLQIDAISEQVTVLYLFYITTCYDIDLPGIDLQVTLTSLLIF